MCLLVSLVLVPRIPQAPRAKRRFHRGVAALLPHHSSPSVPAHEGLVEASIDHPTLLAGRLLPLRPIHALYSTSTEQLQRYNNAIPAHAQIPQGLIWLASTSFSIVENLSVERVRIDD